jgi:hypothetical protein
MGPTIGAAGDGRDVFLGKPLEKLLEFLAALRFKSSSRKRQGLARRASLSRGVGAFPPIRVSSARIQFPAIFGDFGGKPAKDRTRDLAKGKRAHYQPDLTLMSQSQVTRYM